MREFRDAAIALETDCQEAGFPHLSQQAGRLIRILDIPIPLGIEMRATELNALGVDLHNAILEKFTKTYVFRLLPQENYYYGNRYFEAEIRERVPRAAHDLEESGKCLALGRHTATVFHLMRVIEWGLEAVHEDCGAKIPKNRNWATLIQACEAAGADQGITARLRDINPFF